MFRRSINQLFTILGLLKETFSAWQEDKASQLAAALAYYTVFSLTPLLVIAIAIAGSIFGKEAAQEQLIRQIQDLVGIDGVEIVTSFLNNANEPDLKSFASLISLGVLFIGASGVFAQLQESLNQVWNVENNPQAGIFELIRKRLFCFVMVFFIGILLLLSLVLSAIVSGLHSIHQEHLTRLDSVLSFLNLTLSFGITIFLFALMYKFVPDAEIAWKDVWMGATITALLFNFGKGIIAMYLSKGSFASAYGAAGSLVIILVWVYYSAQIVLLGAEFTQVYAKRYGSKILTNRLY